MPLRRMAVVPRLLISHCSQARNLRRVMSLSRLRAAATSGWVA